MKALPCRFGWYCCVRGSRCLGSVWGAGVDVFLTREEITREKRESSGDRCQTINVPAKKMSRPTAHRSAVGRARQRSTPTSSRRPGKVANEGADSRPKPVSQNEPQATAQLSDNCLHFFDRHLREEHVTCLVHFFLDFFKSGSSAFYIC